MVGFESNASTISSALESIRAFTYVPATVTSPSWLGDTPKNLHPHEMLPCRSTLLHLPTMQHYPETPHYFTVNALEFDPDPAAPPPKSSHQFLHQLFDGDLESLELLQEWFGYSLTGDTSQQKMLLMVGPKRSGKGTIARVLTRLIGNGNASGPTTSGLAAPFGLQPLIGKTLAIVSDARFHGENVAMLNIVIQLPVHRRALKVALEQRQKVVLDPLKQRGLVQCWCSAGGAAKRGPAPRLPLKTTPNSNWFVLRAAGESFANRIQRR